MNVNLNLSKVLKLNYYLNCLNYLNYFVNNLFVGFEVVGFDVVGFDADFVFVVYEFVGDFGFGF